MCGIVGYCGKSQAASIVFDGLKHVEYRGYDSAGIASISNGSVVVKKDVGCLDEVNAKHLLEVMPGNVAIGHTRWSTHGAPTMLNAHPHCDCDGKLAVVHNGIIENYQELRNCLVAKGHKFLSETDTEVIPHLIEDGLKEGLSLEVAVRYATLQLQGTYAILVVAASEPTKIVGIRQDTPLIIGVSSEGNYIASDVLSFLHRTDQILSLNDGELVAITADTVEFVDGQGRRTQRQTHKVACDSWDCDKGSYDFFMLKEIEELPWAIVDASIQDRWLFSDVAMDILRARQVIITACGTSRYAALVGRYLFSKVSRKFCDVVMASEFQYFADSLDRDTLVIAVSQSGETADVIQGVKKARDAGAHIVSIVNRPLSMLAEMSHRVIHLNCGSEISVAATKSFLSQLAVFYLLSYSMVSSFEAAVADLKHIGRDIGKAIDWNRGKIESLAKKMKARNDWYYIARGINFAVASEGALKLKEISYAHAEGMPAGELKHGTLSLIEPETPVVVICPNDYTHHEMLSNAIEAKSRGGYIIAVSDEPNEIYDCWIKIPKVNEMCYPLVTVPPLYLLAYHMALERGYNPDKPRNLAKSVTVT